MRYLLLAFALTLSGCTMFSPQTSRQVRVLNLDNAQKLAKKHLFSIHIDELSGRLVNEHKSQTTLLDIPSTIKTWEYRSVEPPSNIYERSRETLEFALAYFRAIEAQNSADAQQQVELRQSQLFDFKTLKTVAKYDSLLKQKKMLEEFKESPAFTNNLQKKLQEVTSSLEQQKMEVRILCGLVAGEEFNWQEIHRNFDIPALNELLPIALNSRDEVAAYCVPTGAINALQSMFPPRSNHTGLLGFYDAELLFRLSATLEKRRLLEQKSSPEALILLQAMAIANEIKADYTSYLKILTEYQKLKDELALTPNEINLKLELENIELKLWLAVEQLKTDLAHGGSKADFEYTQRWKNALFLALELASTTLQGGD